MIERIIKGESVRSVVLEALGGSYNSADYEQISTEPELFMFKETIAAYSPDLTKVFETDDYSVYSFEAYCPELIGTVYDSDDSHPLKIKFYLKSGVDTSGFEDLLSRSFETGEDIRSGLRYLLASGVSTFKAVEIER